MRKVGLLLLALCAACMPASAYTPPPANGSFDLQFTEDFDYNANVGVLNLDGFDTTAQTVAALRARGVYPICYINVGATEDWRDDMGDFPKEVIGKAYEGWEGEHWLDIRRIDLLAPIITKRLDLCASKGFLGVDPDNLDGYQTDTGFPITEDHQKAFLIWLAKEAHKRGLAIGLKNVPELAEELTPYYDWALTESCFDQKWCGEMKSFHAAGKPVYMVEYTDNKTTARAMCVVAQRLGYIAVLKHRNLDGGFRESCD